MRNTLLILLLLISFTGFSQNIAAFSDYQKNFWVFDEGNYRQLEYQPVLDYQVGDKCLAYTTNGNNFKIYNNHIPYEIGSLVNQYTVTDNLVSYRIGSQLYVFENGKKKVLSRFVGHHQTNDSLVAFFDTEKYWFQVFYNGEIITLEDGLLFDDTKTFLVGNNILAYIDAFQNFKIFYQGKTYEILNTDLVLNAKIGRNIMAYFEPITDFLKVFYKGEVIELETFMPKSYQVGYEKVAWVDNVDNFKLFDNGEIYDVSDFAPDKYILQDNILVYHQNEHLFVFYKGQNYLVENYIPPLYKINDNTIVYIDMNGNLNLLEEGNKQILTYEKVNDFEVMRNVVIYNQGVNTTKVYYEGKTYEQ